MQFNEDSRVKIPAILHLFRLGFKYISLNNAVWDTETNIFTEIFKESIVKINTDFYQYQDLRPLSDIATNILKFEQEIDDLLKEIIE